MDLYEVEINGRRYLVNPETRKIDILSDRKSAFGTFDAIEMDTGVEVKIQYLSRNFSLPDVTKPHRIIRPEED